jgi:hypothetical protein
MTGHKLDPKKARARANTPQNTLARTRRKATIIMPVYTRDATRAHHTECINGVLPPELLIDCLGYLTPTEGTLAEQVCPYWRGLLRKCAHLRAQVWRNGRVEIVVSLYRMRNYAPSEHAQLRRFCRLLWAVVMGYADIVDWALGDAVLGSECLRFIAGHCLSLAYKGVTGYGRWHCCDKIDCGDFMDIRHHARAQRTRMLEVLRQHIARTEGVDQSLLPFPESRGKTIVAWHFDSWASDFGVMWGGCTQRTKLPIHSSAPPPPATSSSPAPLSNVCASSSAPPPAL